MRRFALPALLAMILVSLAPAPAEAIPSPHSAVIKHSTSSGAFVLRVCHHWGASSCGSGIEWLRRGKNTKSAYGWADTDGFWIPPKCKAHIVGPLVNSWTPVAGSKGRWKKLPGIFGRTWTVGIRC